MSRFNTFSRILSAALLLAAASACRLSSPSLEEQDELIKRGAFPSGLPRWMPPDRSKLQYESGFLPETFSARPDRERVVSKDEQSLKSAPAKAVEPPAKEGSPLARIAETCPGLEQQVNDALTTTHTEQRTNKLVQLTSRCPNSWDLWFWLAKDYYKQGKLEPAERCLERVLILDKDNRPAQALISEIAGQK